MAKKKRKEKKSIFFYLVEKLKNEAANYILNDSDYDFLIDLTPFISEGAVRYRTFSEKTGSMLLSHNQLKELHGRLAVWASISPDMFLRTDEEKILRDESYSFIENLFSSIVVRIKDKAELFRFDGFTFSEYFGDRYVVYRNQDNNLTVSTRAEPEGIVVPEDAWLAFEDRKFASKLAQSYKAEKTAETGGNMYTEAEQQEKSETDVPEPEDVFALDFEEPQAVSGFHSGEAELSHTETAGTRTEEKSGDMLVDEDVSIITEDVETGEYGYAEDKPEEYGFGELNEFVSANVRNEYDEKEKKKEIFIGLNKTQEETADSGQDDGITDGFFSGFLPGEPGKTGSKSENADIQDVSDIVPSDAAFSPNLSIKDSVNGNDNPDKPGISLSPRKNEEETPIKDEKKKIPAKKASVKKTVKKPAMKKKPAAKKTAVKKDVEESISES